MMLAALLLSTTVVVTADDSYHLPQVERSILEGRCYNRELKLIEHRGHMTLSINGETKDISATSFAKSYISGSYLGRFTIACRRDGKGFSLNFFGMEVPQTGAAATAAGSITYDSSATITEDSSIKRVELNLYEFNKRRNERWLP